MVLHVDISNREDFDRLVQENEKVVLLCANKPLSAASEKDGGEEGETQEQAWWNDLFAHIDTEVATGHLDASTNASLASWILGRDEQGDGNFYSCFVFFRRGKQVYTVPGSMPWPRISRLIALLERSPDTLEQLGHQESLSRRREHAKQPDQTSGADAPEGPEKQGGSSSRETKAVRIFVAGDRSQVGKSSICLGLLGAFLKNGLLAEELAYIKPATQCEKPQLVTEWCEKRSISCRGIGPVVFYKGFTREFLRGGVGTSEELLHELRDAVEDISRDKKVVVVDGVGYPAVGSICGVSNADVAATLDAPVLLVGKSGVGDAVDSYNLNSSFFEMRGVRVLGGVFNRLSTGGFYSLERCREAVTSYFLQFRPEAMPYGFVPEIPSLVARRGPGMKVGQGASTAASASATPPSAVDAESKRAGPQASVPSTQTSSSTATTISCPHPEALPSLPVTSVETEEDFEAFAKEAGDERLVLLDFGAAWCKSCKALVPFAHALPAKYNGAVALATADVEEAPDLSDAHSVQGIPHFVLLKDGVQVDTYTGSSETELLAVIDRHVNMANGKLPSTSDSRGAREPATARDEIDADETPEIELPEAEALIEAFASHVNVARLLKDMKRHCSLQAAGAATTSVTRSTEGSEDTDCCMGAWEPRGQGGVDGQELDRIHPSGEMLGFVSDTKSKRKTRTREEVEAEATEQGASGG